MALTEAEKSIKRINRAVDAIVKRYSSESPLYKEAIKYFYGGDAPKTVKNSAGVLHVSRGKVNLSRTLQLKAIEGHIKEIKSLAKEKGGSFAEKYGKAKGDLESALEEYYTLRQKGLVSKRDQAVMDKALDPFYKQGGDKKPSKEEVVSAWEALRGMLGKE